MKIVKKCLFFIVFMSMWLLPLQHIEVIAASEFEGNESQWLSKCSIPQDTEEQAQKCKEFKEYYSSISKDLENQVSDLNKQIAKITDNISELNAAVKKQDSLIEQITNKIKENENSIKKLNTEITSLEEQIKKLQKSIDERNNLIKGRMLDEQETLGTNISLEIIMGAKNLIDMIRNIDGLNRINEADKKEIELIKEEKEKQDLQKQEKSRLKESVEAAKADNEQQKKNAEEVKKQKEVLLTKFREQEEKLNEQMRSVEVNLATIKNNIINIDTRVKGSYNFSSSGRLSKPVNGSISAHSFFYPDGSLHLGLDIAVPLKTPIYAPANGIILYANNPVATNSGYIGNTSGYPAGAGNSIHMLTRVDGITYGLTFVHMAQEGFAVSAGQKVQAGQLLGLSGNTGNTSGPHCHLEVVNLGNMSIEKAIAQFQATADFAWGTGWYMTGYSNRCEVKGPPCREHPEVVYGY